MKWHNLINHLKTLGFDGDGDDFEAVVKWMAENGHNTEKITVKGRSVTLDDLFATRVGQVFDASAAALDAERDAEIEAAAQKKIDDLERQGILIKGNTFTPEEKKAGLNRISGVRDRIEDDECLGYPTFERLGFGQFLLDIRKHAACAREGRISDAPGRLLKAQKVLHAKAPTGLNEFIDSEGGFLTPTQHQNELLRRTYETGQVFPRARQITMTSKTLDVPYIVESSRADGSRHGGVRGYWVHEADQLTSSQPAFGRLTLTAWKLACLGYVTEELDEDSQTTIGALQLLGDLFAEELAFKMDDAFINGDGSGKPLGILNAPCLITITKDATYANAPTADFTAPDAFEMWSRLWPKSRPNSVWFVNSDVEQQIFQMNLATTVSTPSGGGPVMLSGGSMNQAPQMTLLGRPIVPIEHCPTATAAGSVILADMSQYLHGMRRGITTAQSIHIRFDYDEVAFKATMRGDGQPWWQAALTKFQGTDTLSPFVTIPAT